MHIPDSFSKLASVHCSLDTFLCLLLAIYIIIEILSINDASSILFPKQATFCLAVQSIQQLVCKFVNISWNPTNLYKCGSRESQSLYDALLYGSFHTFWKIKFSEVQTYPPTSYLQVLFLASSLCTLHSFEGKWLREGIRNNKTY